MPFYHKLGNIPHKRHTQHRRPDGELYTEELFGSDAIERLAVRSTSNQ